jgi:hypothetical protein
MQYEIENLEEEFADLPVSPVLFEPRNPYDSVPGLDDEELADPDELERQIMLQEWAPILALPSRHEPRGIRPALDEEGHVDWGAFGTVDFSRVRPEFDKAQYKAEKLREEQKSVLIMFDIVKERLPGSAKHHVLKYLRSGVIDEEDIVNWDMWELAKLDERARLLQERIDKLREASKAKRERAAAAWLV